MQISIHPLGDPPKCSAARIRPQFVPILGGSTEENRLKWLAKHPRFHMHFTATSASWMNMVERFFRNLSENRLKRGVFKSVDDLAAAIELFVLAHNENPKPFIWTKSAKDILQKVMRAKAKLKTVQTE